MPPKVAKKSTKNNSKEEDKVGPVGEALGGNSKTPQSTSNRGNRCKKWFFTWNNYKNEDLLNLGPTLRKFCWKYIFQPEIGKETGTPHLQGCIYLKEKMRWSEFKMPKEIHWETCLDWEASVKYCSKEETRDGDIVYKYGFPEDIEIIDKLRPWQKEIEDLIPIKPDNRKIYWIWSKDGGFGKSVFTKYMAVKHGINFLNGGDYNNVCNIIFNLKMRERCIRMLIFDLPRATTRISYKALEQIKNGMIMNTKYETGVCLFNSPHLIVLSNVRPDYTKLSEDRFIEIRLDDDDDEEDCGIVIE